MFFFFFVSKITYDDRREIFESAPFELLTSKLFV